VASGVVVGQAIASQVHVLAANDVSANTSASSPALTQFHNLSVNNITTTTVIGNATLTQRHNLGTSGVSVGTSVDSPSNILINYSISCEGIVVSPQVAQAIVFLRPRAVNITGDTSNYVSLRTMNRASVNTSNRAA
jgi:hypothetical protein